MTKQRNQLTISGRASIPLALAWMHLTTAAFCGLLVVADWATAIPWWSSLLIWVIYIVTGVTIPSLFLWFSLSYITLFYTHPVLEFLALSETLSQYPQEVVATYTIMVICGGHILAASYAMTVASRGIVPLHAGFRGESYRPSRARGSERALLVCSLLFIASAALTMLDAGGLDALFVIRSVRRLSSSGLSLAGAYAAVVASAGLPLLILRWRFLSGSLKLATLGSAAVADAILFIGFRSRTQGFGHLLAIAVVAAMLHIHAGGPFKKPVRLPSAAKALRLLLAVLLVVGFFGVTARVLRGAIATDVEATDVLASNPVALLSYSAGVGQEFGGDFGYAPTTLTVIQRSDDVGYLGGDSYVKLLMAPVPRALVRTKPENTALVVGRHLQPLVAGSSLPPGLPADAYLNFRHLGLLVFVLMGWLLAIFDRDRVSPSSAVFVALSFPFVFHFARGDFSNSIINLTVLWLASRIIVRYALEAKGQGPAASESMELKSP